MAPFNFCSFLGYSLTLYQVNWLQCVEPVTTTDELKSERREGRKEAIAAYLIRLSGI